MSVAVTHSKARLLGDRCDLCLVVPQAWPGYVSEVIPKNDNFALVRLPIYFPGQNHFHLYRGLGKVISEFRPDLIHIDEEPYSLVTTQALSLGIRFNAKCIAFTWQNILKNYPVPFSMLERFVYTNAPAIIAGNQEAVDILRIKGYIGLTPLIPQFGYEEEVFSPTLGNKDAYGIDSEKVSLAYVGRLVPEKGIQTLIQALSKTVDIDLYIVGTGSYKSDLEKTVSDLKLSQRVHFLGGMASTDVPRFLASIEILALPSLTRSNWKEQFGRVLVEGMASGAVVVGSDSGEIPRVIGSAGMVFPEGNVEALATTLELLKNPLLRQDFIQKGFLRARAFTQQEIVRATVDVYTQVLS